MKMLFVRFLWIFLVTTVCFSMHPSIAVPESHKNENQIVMLKNYLNGIKTLRAKFRQQNPDQTSSYGTMYLKRLGKESFGKMRLEYGPPSYDRLIANGEVLRLMDGRTKDVSDYAIDNTPANFLLSHQIDIPSNSKIQVKRGSNGDRIYLTVERPGMEGVTLTLVFVTSPMLRLQEWTLVDAQRNTTHVVLNDVQIGVALDERLFKF